MKWLKPKPKSLLSNCFWDDHPKLSIILIAAFILLAVLGAPR